MDKLIHMLDDLIELARHGSSALRFSDRGNEMLKKMYTVGIYATILELASDISFLISGMFYSSFASRSAITEPGVEKYFNIATIVVIILLAVVVYVIKVLGRM